MSDKLTITEALAAVMGDVQAVKKSGFNQVQQYSFRGIDAVLAAVGPAFRVHGIVSFPRLLDERIDTYQTSKGTAMFRAVVHVAYDFVGPAGDCRTAEVPGEASDAGDKAVAKAMSVAYRTALIQTLCLPTDEPDPDSFSPPLPVASSSSARGKVLQAKAKLWKVAQDLGWDAAHLSAAYQQRTNLVIGDATAEELDAYRDDLVAVSEPPS